MLLPGCGFGCVVWMGLSGKNQYRDRHLVAPPYYARRCLARYHPQGYIAPWATIYHQLLKLGANVFIGDRVTIFQDRDGGEVVLGDRVHLYGDTYIQTGDAGTVVIGSDTHIQPRCQFSGYKAPIPIGAKVQIAPECAFYPYAHGIDQID